METGQRGIGNNCVCDYAESSLCNECFGGERMSDNEVSLGGCYHTGLAYSLGYDANGEVELVGETFTNLDIGVDGGAIAALRKHREQFDPSRDIERFIVALKPVKIISGLEEDEGYASCSVDVVDTPILTIPPRGLSDNEKADWFRSRFMQTRMYLTIKRQFEPEEVSVYLEDFGLLCCQFEDIVISEFMQVDDFLKHRILVDRQLIISRSIQRQINDLQSWFIAHPKQEDEHKDTIKFRILQQRQLDDKHRYLKGASDRYDALVKERQTIYSNLVAARRDRLFNNICQQCREQFMDCDCGFVDEVHCRCLCNDTYDCDHDACDDCGEWVEYCICDLDDYEAYCDDGCEICDNCDDEFCEEFIADTFSPMNAFARARWLQAKGKI